MPQSVNDKAFWALALSFSVGISSPAFSATSLQTQPLQTQANIAPKASVKLSKLRAAMLSNPKLLSTLSKLNNQYRLADDEIGRQAASKVATTLAESEPVKVYSGQLGIPEGEELLLSLYIEDLYLSDIFALKSATNAQFSLSDLFELIDFPIEVDMDNRQVSGWYLNETQRFTMGLPQSEGLPLLVTLDGVTTQVSSQDYTMLSDDLYVSGDLIETWFDVKFDYNFSDLKAKITSQQPLPVQQRLARQNKQLRDGSRRDRQPVLPWKASHYQGISPPLVDVQMNGSFDKDSDYQSYSLLGSHDFAYLSSDFYASGNRNDTLTDLRMMLSKESAQADLLGPLNATQFKLGDIVPLKIGIGNTPGLSRGLTFSNNGLSRTSNNETINISGDIPPGWDIEIYQNGLLINRQFSLQNGRYEFNDIDLLYGDNQFEMIAYGPQGQVKTESKQVYVEGNKLKARESSYQVSVAELGKSLTGLSSRNEPQESTWAFGSTFEYGMSDWASVNFGLQEVFSHDSGTQSSYALGSDFNLFKRFLFNANYHRDGEQADLYQLNGRTQIGEQALSMRFRSTDIAENENDRRTQTEYHVDHSGTLFKKSRHRLNYRNFWRRTEFGSDDRYDEFGNLLAFNLGYFSINNQLTWRMTPNAQPGMNNYESLNGMLQLQKSLPWGFSRFKMGYAIEPDSEITQAAAQFSVPMNPNLQSDIQFDYYPLTDLFKTQLSLGWQQQAYSLNTNLSYDNRDEWSVSLYGRFSFGYEPNTEQLFMSSRSLSGRGALMVRVFEDENLNGVFDEGEAVIEGAKVKGVQQYRQASSNKDGVAMLTGMTNQLTTDIVLDQRTLGDPFLIPAIPGISVTPRRGHVQVLDFPVVNAGEVEGTVYTRNAAGEEKVAAYATVNLMNSRGDTVATTESEYDGYYLFTDLIPGDYTAVIDPSYLARKKLSEVAPLRISLSHQGEVVNGVDITLEQLQFAKGYVVNLGKFHSLSILKAYWQSVRQRDDSMAQQVFYTRNATTEQYELNAAFFKTQSRAQRGCKHLASKGLQCRVEPFEHRL